MSNERMDTAAARLKVDVGVLADHLWELGVPTQDPGVELSPPMVEAAEAFAARFAPVSEEVPSVDPDKTTVDPAAEEAMEVSPPTEEPAEVQLRSGVRRRRRRVDAEG